MIYLWKSVVLLPNQALGNPSVYVKFSKDYEWDGHITSHNRFSRVCFATHSLHVKDALNDNQPFLLCNGLRSNSHFCTFQHGHTIHLNNLRNWAVLQRLLHFLRQVGQNYYVTSKIISQSLKIMLTIFCSLQVSHIIIVILYQHITNDNNLISIMRKCLYFCPPTLLWCNLLKKMWKILIMTRSCHPIQIFCLYVSKCNLLYSCWILQLHIVAHYNPG